MLERRELFLLITVVTAIAFSSFLMLILDTKAAIGGFVMIIIAAIAYQFPRISLYIFLIYLCFAGTITYAIPGVYKIVGAKIQFSSIYPILHFAKDIFYFPALIAIIIRTKSLKEMYPQIKILIGGLLFFVAICLLNFVFVNLQITEGNPILMGIMGLKIWLGYIPLILCAFYLIRNRQDLFFLTRLQVVLIIICCTLNLIQYLLLINSICDGSVSLPEPANNSASLQAKCLVGGSLLYNRDWDTIRLPGTFVSPWQWGWFLICSIFFTVANSQSDRSKKWQIISWIGTVLVLISSIISGQRIALLIVPIMLVMLILLTERNKKNLPIKLGMISFAGVISLTLPFVQDRISSLISRWNYSPPPKFIWKQLQWAIDTNEGIFGHGLATTSSQARKLGETQLIEVFHAQLIYEMGFLGLLAFFTFVFLLVFVTFKAYQSLKDKSLQNIGICLWIFILFISCNIYYYPLLVDPVAVYYWFVAGILLRLPYLQYEDLKKKKL